MGVIGGLLLLIGAGFAIVGSIMFLIAAFRESVLWGLAVLFIPFAGLFFLILHWQEAKKPFLVSLAAVPFYAVGIIMTMGTAASGA